MVRSSADLGTLVRNRNNNRPGAPNVSGPEGNSSRHPPAMEKHLREMEHYRAFFVGQRDKNPDADEEMPQYIGEWERRWEQLSDGKNTKGSLRFIHCYGQLGIHLLTTHREAEALGVIVARPGVWLHVHSQGTCSCPINGAASI